MWLNAKFSLTRLCGHLVVIQAWLCVRDGGQLWLAQGSQVPRIIRISLLVGFLCNEPICDGMLLGKVYGTVDSHTRYLAADE